MSLRKTASKLHRRDIEAVQSFEHLLEQAASPERSSSLCVAIIDSLKQLDTYCALVAKMERAQLSVASKGSSIGIM